MQPVEHNIGEYISKAIEIYTKDIVNWLIIGVVGTFALGVGFWGGFYVCADKALRGEKPEVGDVLSPFGKIGEFIVPLAIIFVCAMLTFCLIGAVGLIYFQIMWAFAVPLVVLRGLSWKDAAEQSGAIAKQAMLPTFILAFVAGLIGGVFSFITAPLTGIIMTLAYQKQFGAGAPAGQLSGGWAPPAPAPAAAWGPPAAAPAAPAASPSSWAPPAAAPAAAPAPSSWAPPVAAPAPAAPSEAVESGTQSTTANPDEVYSGKTMAMSAVDFEKMLEDTNKGKKP